MDFSGSSMTTVGMFTLGYPAIVVAVVMLIRFFNKDKNLPDTKERRRYPPLLRLTLNVLLLLGLGEMISFIGWLIWSFFKLQNITFSSYFYIVGSMVVIYTLLLVGAVMFIRSLGKNKQPQTGEERRQRLFLRKVLNFLMVAPVIGLLVALIIRLIFPY